MRDDEGLTNEAQFRGQWSQSVCLQKSNANVIMKKLRAIFEAGNEGWDDTELDIKNFILKTLCLSMLMYWTVLDSSILVVLPTQLCTGKVCFQT